MYTSDRLGQVLVDSGVITKAQLEIALERQIREGGKLGEVLTKEVFASEDQIAQALALQKGYDHVNLAAYPVDRNVCLLLPLRLARKRQVIPIALRDTRLVLAMADPLDVEAIDEAELVTGLSIEPVVAAGSQVRFAIEKYVAGADLLQELELVSQDEEDLADGPVQIDTDVTIVRIVNQLVREAVLIRASDIHFEPGEQAVDVRYRVDGVLRKAATLPKSSQAELLSRVKVMADMDITERRRPQDGRFGIVVDGRQLDLRVATLPTPLGEAITLRILDRDGGVLTLEDLGMGPAQLELVQGMLGKPYGAILVSGPTGSGKSTSLYAVLHRINDPGRKIITVEDPIEYRLDGITQMSVNSRIGLTFAAGLRTILRSDPDVVMVGEVRDVETAEIAVRAALTGHLVLTSIHTNDAPSALTRLSDMGVPPYITSAGLLGAVAQRLVRKLCPTCKQAVEIPEARLLAAGFSEDQLGSMTLYGAKGCEACAGVGYQGRTGVFEVMVFDDYLQGLFLNGAATYELRQAAVSRGMVSLRQDALAKVAAGVTTLEEVDRVVV